MRLNTGEIRQKLESKENYLRFFLFVTVVISLELMIAVPSVLAAKEVKDYHYDFINVDINILPNSDMIITETQKLLYGEGIYHCGIAAIPRPIHGYCLAWA